MKHFTKGLLFTTALSGLVACGGDADVHNSNNRGMLIDYTFQGDEIQLHKVDDVLKIEAKKTDAKKMDEEVVAAILANLNGAENKHPLESENLKFAAADEAVTNGMYVFSVETKEPVTLKVDVYDKEAFVLAENMEMEMVAGRNYKALNVENLASGEYKFRLRNQEGNELVRTIQVQNKGK